MQDSPKFNSYELFPMFLKTSVEMDLRGELYWYTLRECYSGSDNLYQLRNIIKAAFESKKPHREKLISKREINDLEKLPDTFPIYRGMTVGNMSNISVSKKGESYMPAGIL